MLKAAITLGLDKWAKRKAVEIAAKLRQKAVAKADQLLEAAGHDVVSPGSIIIREDRDILRPGMVRMHDGRSYRVMTLLMVNKLGAFYEAKAE